MPVQIEMEAMPSEEQITNILADLTRVFVIEIRKQTTHASGAAITEDYNETIQWQLTKGIMVKLMKVVNIHMNNKPDYVIYKGISEVYLNDETFETDLADDGVLDSINDVWLRCFYTVTTANSDACMREANWDPGKVLPKNELNISIQNVCPATEAYAAILTALIWIHYQLFKFDTVDSDALMWEKSTTTD